MKKQKHRVPTKNPLKKPPCSDPVMSFSKSLHLCYSCLWLWLKYFVSLLLGYTKNQWISQLLCHNSLHTLFTFICWALTIAWHSVVCVLLWRWLSTKVSSNLPLVSIPTRIWTLLLDCSDVYSCLPAYLYLIAIFLNILENTINNKDWKLCRH